MSRKVIFLGPGTLQLSEDGKVFEIGDPVTMSDQQRLRLQGAGLRFGAVPENEPPTPKPEPPPLESVEVSRAAMSARASGRPSEAEGPSAAVMPEGPVAMPATKADAPKGDK